MKNKLTYLILLIVICHLNIQGQATMVLGTSMATGDNSFAAGDSSMAIGNTSLAMGKKAKAIGDFSIALGEGSLAEGQWSMAAGFKSEVGGLFSLGFGFLNKVSIDSWFGTAIGAANEVYAWGGTAIGRDNIAYGASASVLGTRSYARTYGETILGAYGEDYIPNSSDPSEWHPLDRVFVVANGWGDGNEENDGNGIRQNALVMLKNGNTTLNGNLEVRNRINLGDDETKAAEEGDIRFNQATKDFEGYTGFMWVSLTNPGMAYERTIAETGNWTASIGNQNAFLSIGNANPPILGESSIANHEDQIDILGLNLSQLTPSSLPYGQGIILKEFDRSTISFLRLLHNNLPFMGTIEIFKPEGDGIGKTIQYVLEGLRIVAFDQRILENESKITDRIKIQFNCIRIQHFDSKTESPTGLEKTWNFVNNSPALSPGECSN